MRREHADEKREDWNPYIRALKAMPFVKDVVLRRARNAEAPGEPDALLELHAGGRTYPLCVEEKQVQRLNRGILQRVFEMRRRNPDREWVLFAPHITPQMGELLAKEGWNYVDANGNGHLRLQNQLFAHVEGKRPTTQPPHGRGMGAPGYRVLFAILARGELLNAPVREFAARAGLGKTTVADALERLKDEGVLTRTQHGRHVVRFDDLLDRWVVGYADVLRPRLVLGQYRTPWAPPELERRIENDALRTEPNWAWGAGAAAFRMTRHYRGEQTVVHLAGQRTEIVERLQAIPARDGELLIIGVPGPIAFEGAEPRTVHPLLVYAELLQMHDERADEAAQELRERYLKAPQ